MKRNHPPSTPTPRRFLPAKKRTTPGPLPQFQSTPRFGSSSAPRPTQTRECLVEDVDDGGEDDEDEEDGFTDSSAAEPSERRRLPYTQDSIEVESGSASTSQGDEGESSDRRPDLELEEQEELWGTEADTTDLLDAEDAPLDVQLSSPDQRQAKRRKISISPVGESSPPPEHYEVAEKVSGEDDTSESASESELAHADADADAAAAEAAEPKHAPQPVFRPAPRFKPTDDEDAAAAQGILPTAFSPQRRGAKYLPGGLAAELQGWLSEVKGWEGADKAATGDDGGDDATMLRLVVEEVRPGRHMHLVKGRAGAEVTARGFILAGQGRLTGLGSRAAAMHEGSVVMVGPPVWDAEMEGSAWTVACDWRVV